MGILFERYRVGTCCLCGSTTSLTGEHKIKASALRAIFGKDAMVIGHFDGQSTPRNAQGPKSQVFHFSARICTLCNSNRTQSADREFDTFHFLLDRQLKTGNDPASVFTLPRYKMGSDAYLNLFRYFAKLLCCHICDSLGPRVLALSEFAIGKTNINHVLLNIDTDPTYEFYSTTFGENSFAGHGGLAVPYNPKTRLPTSFRSSLSLGRVRYNFWVHYGPLVGITLLLFHREFWRKCETAYREALQNPLSD